MTKRTLGVVLIQVAAWSEILVSIMVDGWLYASAHMQNPLWLPHAKLHGAMSFHASIALGLSAVALLWGRRRRLERFDLALAGFLSCAFWIALLTARLWPGTSFTFAGDPAFASMVTPVLFGVPVVPNAVLAAALIICAVLGVALAAPRRRLSGDLAAAGPSTPRR